MGSSSRSAFATKLRTSVKSHDGRVMGTGALAPRRRRESTREDGARWAEETDAGGTGTKS